MDKVKIDLQNCFGIGCFVHEFDFTNSNSVLIYAPNGIMKTSFAKTFDCIAKDDKKNMPKDRVDNEVDPKYTILADEVPIKPDVIFVANAEDSSIDASSKISRFIASKELKKEYDGIFKLLNEEKDKFIKKLKEVSKSTDCEDEFINTFKTDEKSSLFTCLVSLEKDIKIEHERLDFRYNDIFDKKGNVEKFLDKNGGLIDQYFDRYTSLLNNSSFFHKSESASFGTYQANDLIRSVSDGAFFEAKHHLILSNQTDIESLESLKEIFENEINKIVNDEKLKKTFDSIDKAIGANIELRTFKTTLEKDNSLIVKLKDYNGFKKEVWLGYLHELKNEASELIAIFKDNKTRLEELIRKANKEIDIWNHIIDIYNERFHVPFCVRLANQDDVILKEKTAVLEFDYIVEEGRDPKRQNRTQLLEILSRGELRAFHILQILFEIEARKKDNLEGLFIFDDIADSFDYKNKYGIIEYIHDLHINSQFKMILLTHNFDFYRTIASRLNLPSESVFMATKGTSREIICNKGEYRKDVFSHFCSRASEKKIFISLISFIRNLEEYKEGNKSVTYKTLTSCLHIKPDTSTISAQIVCEIYKNGYKKCNNLDVEFKDRNIKEIIYEVADEICEEDVVNEIQLENKITLSMAIRLMAEEFMIKRLDGQIDLEAITKDQTRLLSEKFRESFENEYDVLRILDRVNLMTPEHIHVNTFMYEPLIDMSVEHLINLYRAVSALSQNCKSVQKIEQTV